MSNFDWDRIRDDHETAYARGQIAADMPAGTYSIEELEKISLDMGLSTVEAYRAMERAAAAGKVRSLGLSNWYIEELRTFLPQVDTVPALVQNEIHPYYQEQDVVPYIQNLGIVVEGWYPLGGRGHNAELLADSQLASIAQAHGVSVPQVILRWNRQRGIVIIPGSSNSAHIAEDLDIHGFSLSSEEMARIAALDRAEKHDWY